MISAQAASCPGRAMRDRDQRLRIAGSRSARTAARCAAPGTRGGMRILVTNDDGINAQGLEVCEEIARKISEDVWVIAPEHDQSGVSHSLSLNDPLRLRAARRAALCGEGHADRLRHHGRAPHHAGGARPRAVRRQPRPATPPRTCSIPAPSRRRRRRRCSASRRSRCRRPTPRRASSSRTGRPRSTTRPTSSARARRGHPARRAGQRQLSRIARPAR